MTRRALVIEDDAASRGALAILLQSSGYQALTASSIGEATTLLASSPDLDLAIVDLGLPDGDGLSLLPALTALSPAPAVVVLTGETRLERAVAAVRMGASDFLAKPLDPVRLDLVLTRIEKELGDRDERFRLRRELIEAGRYHGLVGRSAEMRRVFDRIERVAPTDLPVYITGESGTGKELVAHAIHEASRHRRGPFVAINCGAIPRQLAESELFGHEPGAFTGAHRQHIGAFERAGGGTLFLDELTEMPLDLQVVLLRVLENRTFQRVGGTREQPAEVRVIAGSNRDPYAAVRDGRLRQDLFFRLRVMPIEVPPLRARSGDILMLAEHFLAEYQAGRDAPKAFSPFAREAVLSHTWPGNVRELRNAISRAVVLASGALIEPENLDLDSPDTAPRESTRPSHSRPAERPQVANAPRRSPGAVGSSPADLTIPPNYTLAQAERLIVESTLVRFGFNRGLTARALGISDKTLYNKCRAWQLVGPPRPRAEDDTAGS